MKTNGAGLTAEQRIRQLEAQLEATQSELKRSREEQLQTELAATRAELARERARGQAVPQQDTFQRQPEQPGFFSNVMTGLGLGAGFSIADNLIDNLFD